MKARTIIAAAAVALAMTSCSTSQSALNDLRTLSNRIETEGPTYNVQDWSKTAKKYYSTNEKIVKYSAQDKYTNNEVQEIGRLQGQCVKGFAKGAGTNVASKVTNAVDLIKSFVNTITNK